MWQDIKCTRKRFSTLTYTGHQFHFQPCVFNMRSVSKCYALKDNTEMRYSISIRADMVWQIAASCNATRRKRWCPHFSRERERRCTRWGSGGREQHRCPVNPCCPNWLSLDEHIPDYVRIKNWFEKGQWIKSNVPKTVNETWCHRWNVFERKAEVMTSYCHTCD